LEEEIKGKAVFMPSSPEQKNTFGLFWVFRAFTICTV
jgi:hypothetical protein